MEIKRLYAEDVSLYWNKLHMLMDTCYEVTFDGPAPKAFSDKKLGELRTYLTENKAFLFGAIEESQMYGFLWCHELNTVLARTFHVAYGGVDPAAEGRGLFTAMFVEAENLARSLGFHIAELRVAVRNPKVIDIHTKHGYQVEDVIMRKRLDGPTDIK